LSGLYLCAFRINIFSISEVFFPGKIRGKYPF
jgi:hypothetical protein